MKWLCLAAGLMLAGTAQADGTDDYLAGLRALQQGDGEQALYLLEQAANAGLMDAQWRLGELLPGQRGERWLRAAVRQGSRPAAVSLAQRYYDSQQYRRAAQCWLHAARQGSSTAQARLGALQVVGYGLPRDRVQAYAWLNLAASAGDAEVLALRDKLGEQLSAEQRDAGEARSRDVLLAVPPLAGEPPCGE